MDFMDAMKAENNLRKTLTENGAVAYATTGKEMLDFNFKLAGYRKASEKEIQRDFGLVYYEDSLLAVRFIFWVRDIRGGAGERRVFRVCLKWLAEHKSKVAKELIPLVAEYGRFDDILPLLDTGLRKDVSVYYKKQLKEDNKRRKLNQPISLAAKWIPSLHTSSAESRRYAKMLCEDFGWDEQKYRKRLAKLRKYLDIVERKMSAKEWGEIDYNTVPSKANLIYNSAFLRNDENRRRKYLEDLTNGVKDVKINAGVLQPHEIVTKYMSGGWWSNYVNNYDETLEQLWKNLPDMTVSNTLVVRDGSGSMCSMISGQTTCLDVATALTVYMCDHNTGGWKGKFVTFSSHPEVVDISAEETLHDKLDKISNYEDCSNTNIYATMKLILNTAVNNKIPQEEMPETIVICSDMQFDGTRFNLNKTLFEDIIDEYEAAGYKMPRLCFWNINDRGEKSIPLQQNDLGLILCSGFSVQIMKMFMSNKLDPYEILLETINSPRYDAVAEAVSGLI